MHTLILVRQSLAAYQSNQLTSEFLRGLAKLTDQESKAFRQHLLKSQPNPSLEDIYNTYLCDVGGASGLINQISKLNGILPNAKIVSLLIEKSANYTLLRGLELTITLNMLGHAIVQVALFNKFVGNVTVKDPILKLTTLLDILRFKNVVVTEELANLIILWLSLRRQNNVALALSFANFYSMNGLPIYNATIVKILACSGRYFSRDELITRQVYIITKNTKTSSKTVYVSLVNACKRTKDLQTLMEMLDDFSHNTLLVLEIVKAILRFQDQSHHTLANNVWKRLSLQSRQNIDVRRLLQNSKWFPELSAKLIIHGEIPLNCPTCNCNLRIFNKISRLLGADFGVSAALDSLSSGVADVQH